MKSIKDIYADKAARAEAVVSFEFFPPRTPQGEVGFERNTVPTMAQLSPDYCSVTYGAGGSTREKTLGIVERIQREHHLPALTHLTCVGSTREQLEGIAREAKDRGIQNVLALRGDPPEGSSTFEMTEGGFQYAWQLVEFLRAVGGFSVGVAGFPEGHIECPGGKKQDWDHLKAKIGCGADFVITQLFFDNRHFYEFREYLWKAGVGVPIIPGIIPILSTKQIKKFTALCGAELPADLLKRLESLGDDTDAVAAYGIEYATRQCEDLLGQGVPGLHFYTLNKSRSTATILANLGLRPRPEAS